jgi:hypothetical protein
MIAVANDPDAEPTRPAPPPLYEVDGDTLRLNFHAGQWRAWHSPARFVAVLAGTQGGKTAYGPWHLWHKIHTEATGGDYLAVTSSYDLFKLKMLPALRETFEHVLKCGRYWSGDRIIELRDPATGKFWATRADDRMWGRIILRSAESGGGLESTTAKGAWLDEAGQDAFSIDIFYAVLRRLSLSLGWLLITTTLYNFGPLKSEFYDRWTRGEPGYDVIHFDSTENPTFPAVEFERARASMPLWKFNMQYRGIYERPAGWIYDSFQDEAIVPRFSVPHHWPRYLGLDFGGVNTAGVFYANEPNTDRLYAYREYKAGGRTAAEHAAALQAGEPGIPAAVVGGSKSEGQWRDEFKAAGLPVREPAVSDVEVGINRVYGCHARGEIFVFSDLDGYLAEKRAYSRKLDSQGNPTEDIDAKNTYHFMDAERYIVGWLRDSRDYSVRATPNPFGIRREPEHAGNEYDAARRPARRNRLRI